MHTPERTYSLLTLAALALTVVVAFVALVHSSPGPRSSGDELRTGARGPSAGARSLGPQVPGTRSATQRSDSTPNASPCRLCT